MSNTITPQVGKRYVTRGGWVTPPWTDDISYPAFMQPMFDLISEYVEPAVPTTNDAFRRDLIARLYVAMVTIERPYGNNNRNKALSAIEAADTLIEAMEGEV